MEKRIFRKNEIVELTIEDLGENGEGIGKTEGYTLFVKNCVIGDRIEAKIIKAGKTYGYGRLMRVLTPSPDRTEPPCPVAGPCGGCQLQMMKYEAQLGWKQRKIENMLTRIGGFEGLRVKPVLGMKEPCGYRNKAQYPLGLTRDGRIVAGFYAGHTHSIIPLPEEGCLLGPAAGRDALRAVIRYMEKEGLRPYDEASGKGDIRHVLIREARSTGEILVCLVANRRRLPAEESLASALLAVPGVKSVALNVNRERTNVILGRETRILGGNAAIEDEIGSVRYRISPVSFYQVNPLQTRVLYEKVKEFAALTGTETLWDLYCGIGTIGLFLADGAREVKGIEIVEQAVRDAEVNARLNTIDNASYMAGRAEELLPRLVEEGARADVVVVDPPRKGCGPELLDALLTVRPERIVYVSCDPATLARDLKILAAGGYEVKEVQPVDMFPMTVHVETVVLMSRVKE